jgi:hypothetical protein
MADDLADYPIVVLENDYPEQVGKVGLFDIQMPVGDTGLIFIAAMPGRLYLWGPTFTPPVEHAAYLRAASTLVQMGLVRGETFAFLRYALQLSVADVAALYGVLEATVVGWEDNSIPIPQAVWNCFSYRVMLADGRAFPANPAFDQSFRPRVIRVFPNIPMVPQAQDSPPACPNPPSNLPQADCFPPSRRDL